MVLSRSTEGRAVKVKEHTNEIRGTGAIIKGGQLWTVRGAIKAEN